MERHLVFTHSNTFHLLLHSTNTLWVPPMYEALRWLFCGDEQDRLCPDLTELTF